MLTTDSIIDTFFKILEKNRETQVAILNNIEAAIRRHGMRNLGPSVLTGASVARWSIDAYDYVLNEKALTVSEEDFVFLMDSLIRDMISYNANRIGFKNHDAAYYETLSLIWEIGREKKAHFARVKSE